MKQQSVLLATRRLLRRQKIDSLIVTHLPNIRYLTGFSGSTALMLVTPRRCLLLLDPRYLEQARSEVRGAIVVAAERESWKTLVSLIQTLRLREVGFEFRAMRYDLFCTLRRALTGVSLKPQDALVETLRRVKTTGEIAAIEKALRLTEEVFEQVLPLIRPGMREIELAAELEFRLRRNGAEALSFDTIVASGHRSAYPHGVASRKRIRPGDPIVLDFGICLRGYVSDFTRTVVSGRASRAFRRAYGAVQGALKEVENSPLAGKTAQWIDSLCRSHLDRASLGGYIAHGTGHGIGLEVHEAPSLNAHNTAVIQPQEVFTIEPGVYVPGRFGIRIEDIVSVGKVGCRRLNKTEVDLVEL